MEDPSTLLQLDEKANAAVASFVALLRGAGEREQAAKREARHWQTQAAEWQQKYEAARRHAEMLHKLSIENYHRQNADETDRGHITTILEHDDANHPLSDHAGLSFTDAARSMLDEYDASKGLSSVDSIGSQRNLPRVSSAVTTPSTRPMRTTVGSLASWLMAYTMMQPGASGGRNGTTSKFDNDQEISAVSVLDDDGASGVGAAAAAAVSVALARSWAAAASQKQAAMVERTTSGSLKPGRAGFRLVAAVSNTDLVRLGGSNKRSTYDPEEATPMGSSTSSNRGGSTPFFTSPKASSLTPAQSGTTPFASLSEMPFTESEGALTVEAQSQSQPQSHAYTQPLPPPASQKKQAQTSMDSQTPSAFGSLDVVPSLSPAETPGPLIEAPPPPPSSSGSRQQDSRTQEPAPDSPTFSQRDRSERASSPGALAGWHVFKPVPQAHDFKTAGSLPILQSAMHRRSAFAQGAGVLPPSLGVTPSFEGPFPPQALILKDSSHRREAYAKGQGALPPAFSSRPTPPRANSSDSDTLPEASSSAFLNLGEATDLLSELSEPAGPKDQLGRLVPSGRVMKQVESFNTDVVRQSIDKANRTDTTDKHISSAGSHLELHWLNPPRKILVVAKPSPDVLRSLVRVAEWLLDPQRAMHVYVEPSVYARLGLELQRSVADGKPGELVTWTPEPETGTIPRYVADGLDAVVTLGGDGTVLWTCSILGNGSVPPLVPFAMGSLGFMTPFAMEKMTKTLEQIIRGGFSLMLRHRLHCKIERAETETYLTDNNAHLDEQVVLNEVVIDRGVSPFLCNLECFCDGNFVTHVQGDGLIVSTPTGSTAYNLAAGGSMVHPQVPGVLFTPINPHSLSSRPLVLPESIQIRVKVPADSRSEMWCSFDGKDRQRLAPGDAVLIYMSQHPIPTVCKLDASHDWFLSMHNGLHWNIRKQQAGAGK
ncbi:MAG: NAD(H) kinase 1-like [Trebouxia sp. A1-2]|nr:MAG: NAD(H) kinase 1-like [Trebouxia sp. A1-2]